MARKPEQVPEKWLNTKDVAELLGCTQQHIYNLINRGELKAMKPKGKLRTPHHSLKVPASELEAYRKRAYSTT